jgi:hypothetical protein
MSSAVDICNLALAYLGDDATVSSINPPEGSAQADHCARFYPIARDTMLEQHAWGFAIKRIALAVLSTTETPAQWLYTYGCPSGCLRPLAVLMGSSTDDTDEQQYVVEALSDGTRVIHTNTENATLKYIASVTDTTKFSPLFVSAAARLLASYLSGPVLKGGEGIKVGAGHLKQFYTVDLPMAKSADARAGKVTDYNDFTPANIAARA